MRGKRMAEKPRFLPSAALPASGSRGRPNFFGPLSLWLPRYVINNSGENKTTA